MVTPLTMSAEWTLRGWEAKPSPHLPTYPDAHALDLATAELRRLPPLVTSWEIEALKSAIAEAQEGNRFLLQGGDCAETMADCVPSLIVSKLDILFRMSRVLDVAANKPVLRVGRFAGQYAKPRSSPTEVREGVTLPSYMGDLVNRPAFTEAARRPDPSLLVSCYQHAALTLNFVRALASGDFADLRKSAGIEHDLQEGGAVPLFTSHEGLNLHYEAAQTRTVPHRPGYYDLSTHMPWIGERTRDLAGPHVEFFRGVENPIGIKVGPTASADEIDALCNLINPRNAAGKVVLVTRMGATAVGLALPPIVARIREKGRRVLWVCDPMHGNGITTKSGLKTRHMDDILRELEATFDVHDACGTVFGGVHFELTGESVTECLGAGTTEADLDTRYLTACDPRLNARQSIELASSIARRMRGAPSMRPQSSSSE